MADSIVCALVEGNAESARFNGSKAEEVALLKMEQAKSYGNASTSASAVTQDVMVCTI
jgi:hypothetical protein